MNVFFSGCCWRKRMVNCVETKQWRDLDFFQTCFYQQCLKIVTQRPNQQQGNVLYNVYGLQCTTSQVSDLRVVLLDRTDNCLQNVTNVSWIIAYDKLTSSIRNYYHSRFLVIKRVKINCCTFTWKIQTDG